MSWRLKTSARVLVWAALSMTTVVAVVLALFPTTAEAQGTSPRDTSSIVVVPGDSLWSISEEQLGPNATLRQIDREVERIYSFNEARIGSDPNLIFPGQKLSLPPASAPSRTEPVTGTTPAQEATEPATEPTKRAAATETEGQALKPTEASQRHPAPDKASKKHGYAEAKPVAAPDLPRQQDTPKVGSPTEMDTPSPVESLRRSVRSLLSAALPAAGEHRSLLGLGIMALTVLVVGLLAWKLPLKRNVGGFEAGSIPKGYGGDYTYPAEAADRHADTPGLALESPILVDPDPSRSFGGEATAAGSSKGRRRRPPSKPSRPYARKWEIGEPLKRSIGSLPLQPGAFERHALSEVKPLAEDALTSLTTLERRRHLTVEEHRQAEALQRMLATLEEVDG